MTPPSGESRTGYRPDVDGLRAIAVLLVLADHLDTPVTGGYVGVDVFFVISGYLISASILSDMARGRFSIVGFYERRVRRIFPAMLAMLAVVTALTWCYLLPSEMASYARSLLAAIGSGSNFWFWQHGGYFDLDNNLKPLLHTWSLGVEEQFYILFPIFLVVIRRWFPSWLKSAILAVALVSFVGACVIVRSHGLAAFFFAPLRAWELLIGTIVSQRYLPSLSGAVSRNLASGLGLLLILIPGLTYGADTMFPGLTALPPCLGAALIIAAGETGSSAVGRLLAWRPVAFIGLISYSLYLWHWPIIVFQRAGGMLLNRADLTLGAKAFVAAVSIAVAALSWKFVEQPFRKGAFRPGRRSLFAINGMASLGLAALAVGIVVAHGLPGRFPPQAQRMAAYSDYETDREFRTGVCFITPANSFANFQRDVCLPNTGKRSILLAGDSHAADLWPGLAAAFPDRDLLQVTGSSCAPMLKSARAYSPHCVAMFDFLFNDYLEHHKVDMLLLSSNWRAADLPGLERTVDYARERGIPLVLIGPSFQYNQPEPRLLAFALRDGHMDVVATHMEAAPRMLDRQMAELARTRWHVGYISVFDTLCKPACPLFANSTVPLLFDGGHLTTEGSILLMDAMRADPQFR